MQPVATEITSDEDGFTVRLANGGELRVSFECFPWLNAATPEQRRAVRISISGARLHWDQLDENISVVELSRDVERRHLRTRLKSVGVAVKVDLDDL